MGSFSGLVSPPKQDGGDGFAASGGGVGIGGGSDCPTSAQQQREKLYLSRYDDVVPDNVVIVDLDHNVVSSDAVESQYLLPARLSLKYVLVATMRFLSVASTCACTHLYSHLSTVLPQA